VLSALETVPAKAQAHLTNLVSTPARVSNGWAMNTVTIGVYRNCYANARR